MPDRYGSNYLWGSNLQKAFNSEVASFNGEVYTSANSMPSMNPRRGQGMGIVNFQAHQNDGCGSGLFTCQANNTCKEKILTGFTVESGPCVADEATSCVTSKG